MRRGFMLSVSPIQKMKEVSFARHTFHQWSSRRLISDEERHRSGDACRNYETRNETTPVHIANGSTCGFEAVTYDGSHQLTWIPLPGNKTRSVSRCRRDIPDINGNKQDLDKLWTEHHHCLWIVTCGSTVAARHSPPEGQHKFGKYSELPFSVQRLLLFTCKTVLRSLR
jgi:hypothetical protein